MSTLEGRGLVAAEELELGRLPGVCIGRLPGSGTDAEGRPAAPRGQAPMRAAGPTRDPGHRTVHDAPMSVLVTGGAGFLGAHVVRALIARGEPVVVLDDLSGGARANVPDGVPLVVGDIGDPTIVEAVFRDHQVNVVFHLAAYAAEGLSHFIRRHNYLNNVVGSMTLINEAIRRKVRRFVFTSSIAVYGTG